MGKNLFRCCLAILLVTALSSLTLAQESPKPLGAWFGSYQVLTFNDEIVWPLDLYADTHYAGPIYYQSDPSFFDRYCAVLIGIGGRTALTKPEIAGLDEWVARGGVLILTGNEGFYLFEGKMPSWIGAQSWWSGTIAKGSAQLIDPEHPLAKDLSSEEVATLSGIGGLAGPWGRGASSIIGKDNFSFLLVNPHRNGYVVYLGGELCPQSKPKSEQKKIIRDMSPLAVKVWKNLIELFNLPTRGSVIAQWFPKTSRRNISIWWRYEKEKPLGGALYFPPFPHQGEELPGLTFDVGIGERNWKYFFVTNGPSLEHLIVTPTDLAGHGNKKIPAEALSIYVQEKPYPDYPKAPYWLVEPQYVEPQDSLAVRLDANRTTTWWVKFRCVDVPPGEYTGTLEFRDERKHLAGLPVKVKVWPLYQPGPNVLHYELEHRWYGMPGGFYIRPKNPVLFNPDLLAVYMEHLAELGVDFGQTWGDVHKWYCSMFVRLKETGELLKHALSEDPELLNGTNPPHLDFSGYDSLYFDNAVKVGLTNFAMHYSGAAPLSKDWNWRWSEYATYLKERGYPWVYTKILDEIGPTEVDEFIQHAAAIRPAGFRTYTTTYNFQYDAASVAKIDPWLDLWQWASYSKPWAEIAKHRKISWDPDNVLWGTTSSSYWGNYIDFARGAGWTMAWRRYKGLHTHGYFKYYWNDHIGALPGPDGPFDSVTVIANSQGVYQGRYLASLYRMIDYARDTGIAPVDAARVEKELAAVVGPDKHLIIPILSQKVSGGALAKKYGSDVEESYTEVCLSPERYEEAKRRIFDLILHMKGCLHHVRPNVKYGDTYLVTEGKPVCCIISSKGTKHIELLLSPLSEFADRAIPVLKKLRGGKNKVSIFLGTFEDNEELQKIVNEEVPGQITSFYPGPGRYAVKYLPESKRGPLILIVGGDLPGLEKGVKSFVKFLVIENRW